MKNFIEAIIQVDNGTLIVDATRANFGDSHYNVSISDPTPSGEYTITGDLPKYGFSMEQIIPIHLLADNSIEEYKPLFKKPILKQKRGWFEYKERNKKTYTTNKIIIIE